MTINPTVNINKGHIYFTDKILKVKCITNKDNDNKQHLIDIGNIYTANTTTSHMFNKYYYINERQTVMPAELFIPIDELRDELINEILLSSRSSLLNEDVKRYPIKIEFMFQQSKFTDIEICEFIIQ